MPTTIETFDCKKDFSARQNPNGPWTVGYSKALGNAFALIPFDNTVDGAGPIKPGFGWTKTGYLTQGAPIAWVNLAAATKFGVPAGAFSLHPGPLPNGDYAVLRFTAPHDALYTISGGFGTGDTGHTNGVVVLNGAFNPPLRSFDECIDGTSVFAIGPIQLGTGQTLDFIVGNKGNFAACNTPLAVTVTDTDGGQSGVTVNQYVESLGDLPPILLTEGDTTISTTTVNAPNGYVVTEQARQYVENVTEQSYLNDVAMELSWPGQVLQGSPILNADTAAIGPFDRQPGTITISTALTLGSAGSMSARVQNPTNGNVTQARLDLLQARQAKDSGAPLKGSFKTASTFKEVGAKAHLAVSTTSFGVDANAALNQQFKNTTAVAVLRQDFYTVSFAPDTAGASGFWKNSVKQSDLARYMSKGNPPLFVESVTYGRLIVVSATAAFSGSSVAAALNAHYAGNFNVKVDGDYSAKDIVDASEVKIYTIGVPGHIQFQKLNDAFNELNDVYKAGLVFDTNTNPGAVVAFTCRHIADNTVARTSLVASYTQLISAVGTDVKDKRFQVWDGPGGGLISTNINVNPGDKVVIDASGSTWGGTFFGLIAPDGWIGSSAPQNYPMPGAPQYSLIAKVGDGDYVEVGKHKEFVPPKNVGGILQLNLNDDNPYNGGADRKWDIVVNVTRGNAGAAGVYI